MALDTIRSNRIKLSDPFDFTGILRKNAVDLATVNDLQTAVYTLQNKVINNTNTVTLKDSLFTLQDDGDVTRQAKFQLSGITAGNTRTFTLPDVSDEVVVKDSAQTLTNKTLTSPVLTTPQVNMGADANGDIYTRIAGATARLAKGTEQQSLTMQDTGLPGWSDGAAPLLLTFAGHDHKGASGDIKVWDFWGAFTNNDSRIACRDNTTATTGNHFGVVGARGLMDVFTAVAAGSGNINVGCRVVDTGVDKVVWANDGAATLYIADTNFTGIATVTFHGDAPTAIRRIGYDHVNGYLLIADGADKAAVNIRRYTLAATIATNINSDITLDTAPANAGCATIFYGRNYIIICDTAGSAVQKNFQRYARATGVKIDTVSIRTPGAGTVDTAGLFWSVKFNKLYMGRYFSTLNTCNGLLFELLDID